MPTGLLDGEEVVRLLWARFNPTKADKGRRAPSSAVELLGELDAPSDRDARPPGRDPAEGADRAVEPGLQRLAPARGRRPRRRADDPRREHGRQDADGVAARGDADPPAVHPVGVRARARAPPRAPAAEARLPAASHDQPRRRAARPGPRLRPLRAGARVPGAARRDGDRRDLEPVQGLDLPDAPGTRPGAEPRGAVRGGRLLRRADRVRRRLQGRPRRVSPARAVGLEPAARPRHPRQGAQVPDRQRRRHAAADRHQVRVADRDPVRVRRPRPHRRAAQPLRRGARQLHARDLGPERKRQDDDREHAGCRGAWRQARARS